MGNQVSVDNAPFELNSLDKRVSSGRNDCDSNVKAWKLFQEEDGTISHEPVHFMLEKAFAQDCCYVILHIYKTLKSAGATNLNSKEFRALQRFAATSENMTPRGVEYPFTVSEGRPGTTRSVAIYVYNGKRAPELCRAFATSKAASLETQLSESQKTCEIMVNCGDPIPLLECFKGDTRNLTNSNRDEALLRCHLYSQLHHQATTQSEWLHPVKGHSSITRKALSPYSLLGLLEDPLPGPRFRALSNSAPDVRLQIPARAYGPQRSSICTNISELTAVKPRSKTHASSSPKLSLSSSPGLIIPALKRNMLSPRNHANTSPMISPRRPLYASPGKHIFTPRSSGTATPRSDIIASPTFSLGESDGLKWAIPIDSQSNGNSSSNPSPERTLSGFMTQSKLPGLGLDLRTVGASVPDERQRRLDFFIKEVSEVEPYMFVGSDKPARDRGLLHKFKISHVLNAAAMVCDCYWPNDFIYQKCNLLDSPEEGGNMISLFPFLIRFIETVRINGGKMYIHCYQGVSRSCTIAICHLMWKQGLTYDQAYAKVRSVRGICSPNSGFIAILLMFEKHLATKYQAQLFRLSPFNTTYSVPFVLREEAAIEESEDGHIPVVRTPPSSLDPRTGYVLMSPQCCFLWRGAQCPDESCAEMERLLPILQRYYYADRAGGCGLSKPLNPMPVVEGEEPVDFWALLHKINQDITINPIADYDSLYSPDKFLVHLQKLHEEQKNGDPSQIMPNADISAGIVDQESFDGDDNTRKPEKSTRIEMYSYPELEIMPTFDSDDLFEDSCRIVVKMEPGNTEIHVWIGEDLEMDEDTYKYAEKAAAKFQKTIHQTLGCVVVKTVLQGEESDEFFDLFENG